MAVKRREKRRKLVPRELMIEVGSKYTKITQKCADSWDDSTLRQARAELPLQFHAVPTDWLKIEWQNLRKNLSNAGDYRMNVGGHGPAKGSRTNRPRKSPPKWYKEYCLSERWQKMRTHWFNWWKCRCAICNEHQDDTTMDLHHRTYERIGKEEFQDLIPLCRRCHDLYHDNVPAEKPQRSLFE